MAGGWLALQGTWTSLNMSQKVTSAGSKSEPPPTRQGQRKSRDVKLDGVKRRRRLWIATGLLGALAILLAAATLWISSKATTVKTELEAAMQLVPQLKEHIASDNPAGAAKTVEDLRQHTGTAREAVGDPVWTLASALPGLGPNLNAISEVARAADDVSTLGLAPLVKVFGTLDWESLLPSGAEKSLAPLQESSPTVVSAAYAVRASADRLDSIDVNGLLPQVAEPMGLARGQLNAVTDALDAAANASQIVPGMLGATAPRSYLLMIQNNAESRASGGIPGALAVLNLDKGKLTLGAQSSAGDVGVMSPTMPVDSEQQEIYSGRLGKFMQDVNLTPDFPTAAATARAMWEQKSGQRVDGVISIDPVTLSYILNATGPVSLSSPDLVRLAGDGLPTELNDSNVVQTLLSDVYVKIAQPKLQDIYFAGVAKEVFGALSDGKGDANGLIQGITRGTEEGRVRVWSAVPAEQSIISQYAISGSISGPSISPAQFGVYFNDGTGAKMDYYVKRTVQLVKECVNAGYEQTTVRITSSNTAPADAATSLPSYVTGAGNFGVPPGTVQTNIVAYGPIQANVETAKVDGAKTEFAPYIHSGRPVGVVAVRLAPGESRSVEFTFGKIVQHTEPNLVVTPTVQDVKDVILPTLDAQCG